MGTGIFFGAMLNSGYCRWRGRPGLAEGSGNMLCKGEQDWRHEQVTVENTMFKLFRKIQGIGVLVGKERERDGKERNQKGIWRREKFVKTLCLLQCGWMLYGSNRNVFSRPC